MKDEMVKAVVSNHVASEIGCSESRFGQWVNCMVNPHVAPPTEPLAPKLGPSVPSHKSSSPERDTGVTPKSPPGAQHAPRSPCVVAYTEPRNTSKPPAVIVSVAT